MRTPWEKDSSTEQTLSCGNCQGNSTGTKVANKWRTSSTGSHSVRFPGLAPSSGAKYIMHATALNTAGVTCAPTSPAGTIGDDLSVQVVCRKDNFPTNTRFMITVNIASGTKTIDEGFATVVNGIRLSAGSWSSRGATPTATRTAAGRYTIGFADLIDTTSGGNAQVTSATPGLYCRLTNWGTSAASGTSVAVRCQNSSLQDVDSNASVSFTRFASGWEWQTAYAFANQATLDGTYTPSSTYLKNMGSTSMTISHTPALPGRYTVTFNSGIGRSRIMGHLSAWNGTGAARSPTSTSARPGYSVSTCSTGAPVDTDLQLRGVQRQHDPLLRLRAGAGQRHQLQVDELRRGYGLIREGAAGAFVGTVTASRRARRAAPTRSARFRRRDGDGRHQVDRHR